MKLPGLAPGGCHWPWSLTKLSEGSGFSLPLLPCLSLVSHAEPHPTAHHLWGQLRPFTSLVVLCPEVFSGCSISLSATTEFLQDDGWHRSRSAEFEKHSELIRRNESDGLRVILAWVCTVEPLLFFWANEVIFLWRCAARTVPWRVAKSALQGAKTSLYLTSLLRNFSNITENDTRGNWNHEEILAQPQMTAFSIVITWNSSSSVWKILFQTPCNWT